MPSYLKTLLTIAGSDPLGGAGIQCDIRCGSSLGVHVLTAITAVTSQNSTGMVNLGVLDSKILKSQLDAILVDTMPDAIKIGLIGSIENLSVIVDFLNGLSKNIPVVLDPILKISADHHPSFHPNTSNEYLDSLVKYLIPLCSLVTPNLEEYEILKSRGGDFPDNCKTLITKGGHSGAKEITDFLISKDLTLEKKHRKVECKNLHGTGCAFSSFLASYLALGYSLKDAFLLTSDKLFEIIENSVNYSLGSSDYGPLNINKYFL